MAVRRKEKLSLAEQVAELSNPLPDNFEDEIDVAKVCDYSEDVNDTDARRSICTMILDEDDTRYEGRAISRHHLEQEWEMMSDKSDDETCDEDEPDAAIVSSENEEEEDKVSLLSDEEESSQHPDTQPMLKSTGLDLTSEDHHMNIADNNDVIALSHNSIADDIAKGKAVKDQLSLWDGLLEGRIKLHKPLVLSNQLPPPETAPLFLTNDTQSIVNNAQQSLQTLLDNLLDLQFCLMEKRPETQSNETSSNIEDDSTTTDIGFSDQFPQWVGSNGERCYESYIAKMHERFQPYRDTILDKWNTKLQLSTGKLTNKSYLHKNQSIVTAISHVLKNKQRLRRRTQLKRCQVKILGKRKNKPVVEQVKKMEYDAVLDDMVQPNMHLMDIDEEIFDDEDFYHQLLRELIQSKTSLTDTDQITMGRHWLQLQSLHNKIKNTVDTKASKGRKLRYQVHQKLVGFMAPMEERGGLSDTARCDLFSSLFGSRQQYQ